MEKFIYLEISIIIHIFGSPLSPFLEFLELNTTKYPFLHKSLNSSNVLLTGLNVLPQFKKNKMNLCHVRKKQPNKPYLVWRKYKNDGLFIHSSYLFSATGINLYFKFISHKVCKVWYS